MTSTNGLPTVFEQLAIALPDAPEAPLRADALGIPEAASTVTATGDNNIDGVLSGFRWASTVVSFSFTNTISDYEDNYANRPIHASSFQSLNATQRAVALAWIGPGGHFYNVSLFSSFELSGDSDRDATIRMAISSDPRTAYAYYPDDTVEGGDIWFNPNDYNNPVIGNYAYYTFGHELGHALGLKHGHELAGAAGVAMNPDRDSMEFSIMTYRSYVGASTDFVSNETWGYAQTLMMYDIRAIQEIYGAWFGYNATDTTYTFSLDTGEMFVNGAGTGTPGGNRIFRTIWDGDGVDTYDFSNYTTSVAVDLTPGGWSDLDVGGTFQRSYLGGETYARGHVFNALQYYGDTRSLIENANGGFGDDRLTGNIANNRLTGNEGNDTIYGGEGNDTVDGGNGDDIIYLDDGNDFVDVLALGNDTFYGGNGDDYIYGSNGNETYYGETGNDTLQGYGGDDYLDGGQGDDFINGQSGFDIILGGDANDSIFGGEDDDVVSGDAGDDSLTGGGGFDSFAYNTNRIFNSSAVGFDSIIDFDSALDQIVLDKTTFSALFSRSGYGFSLASEFAVVTSDVEAANSAAYITYNTDNGRLFYNQNGNTAGFGSGALFATLLNETSGATTSLLSASSFLLQA